MVDVQVVEEEFEILTCEFCEQDYTTEEIEDLIPVHLGFDTPVNQETVVLGRERGHPMTGPGIKQSASIIGTHSNLVDIEVSTKHIADQGPVEWGQDYVAARDSISEERYLIAEIEVSLGLGEPDMEVCPNCAEAFTS